MLENISKRPFYQWDIGAKLRVIEPPGCTIAYVHFCCDRFSDAVVVEVQRGDELTARVPDEFLQFAGKFCAYTVCVHPDGQETVEQSVFRVIQKKRPEGYVYTPTEHRSWEQLDERIKKLETGGTGGGGSGGVSLPPGGKAGQVLTKASDADGDVTWADPQIPPEYGLITYYQDRKISVT